MTLLRRITKLQKMMPPPNIMAMQSKMLARVTVRKLKLSEETPTNETATSLTSLTSLKSDRSRRTFFRSGLNYDQTSSLEVEGNEVAKLAGPGVPGPVK
jgi:uncharacterized protein involved in exopolysaccharide biosynthesis